MHTWRHNHLAGLGRILILLVLLGQTVLLWHETEHSVTTTHVDCQVCLHAQPSLGGQTHHIAPAGEFTTAAVVSHFYQQPVVFLTASSRTSRGPPQA